MNRAIRILLLTTDLDWGGAERVVHESALGLAARGFSPTVVGLRRPGGELAQRLAADGIDAHALPRRGTARALRAFLAATPQDLVHAHLYHAAELARHAVIDLPWIVHVHNVETRWLPWRFSRESHQARTAHAVLAPSAAIAADWSRRTASPAESVRLVPHPIAPPSRPLPSPRTTSELRFGFLGRLVRTKGADLWPRAFPQGLPAGCELDVAGEGPCESALARWAGRTGTRVTRRGWVRDLDGWMEGIDALIVPSRQEGFGLAAAEAMMRERPVLMADLPALRELAGSAAGPEVFFEPDSQGLATAVQSLLARRGDRLAWIRERGEQLRAAHDPDRCIDRLVAVYEELVPR